MDAGCAAVVFVVEGGDDEEDEVEEEADLHHHFATVEFVVDHEGYFAQLVRGIEVWRVLTGEIVAG